MAGVFDLIKDINAGRQTWKLKVRVVRMWNVCPLDEPNKPFAVEMVLVDVEGSKIQASIRKPMMRKFQNAIVEGDVYKITFFGVVPNVGSYRASRHEFKLLFHSKTRVVPCESLAIPVFGLSLTDSTEIHQTEGKSDFLLDVMGILTSASGVRVSQKNRKSTRFMILELVDLRGKIQCAVFGPYVDVVKEFMSMGTAEMPVVVIQFSKVKNYRGEVVLQNVMNTSRILWNPEITEAIEFKERMKEAGFDINAGVGLMEDERRSVPKRVEFLEFFPRKTIKELHITEEDGVFVVLASILTVLKEDTWWYPACKCLKAVTPDGGAYYCPTCGIHVLEVTPRFKLKIEVDDGEDSAAFVLFDTDSSYLLGLSCASLLAELEDPKCKDIPKAFENLTGRELLFKVEKEPDHSFRYDDTFKVKKVCDDKEIILSFKDESSVKTPTKSKIVSPFSKVDGCSKSTQCSAIGGENVVSLSDDDPSPLCDSYVGPSMSRDVNDHNEGSSLLVLTNSGGVDSQ